MDPEYAVIGRVARRIWAKAMRFKYGANERSQMLKYHIQTSGRSAARAGDRVQRHPHHAAGALRHLRQLQLLHTNAYDEAITTPTEESVRRAVAIQLIINRELGLAKNENPLQGSFIVEELTDLVEEAVLRSSSASPSAAACSAPWSDVPARQDPGGVLYYETLKHTGELPIIGVNTFLSLLRRCGVPASIAHAVFRFRLRNTDASKNIATTTSTMFQTVRPKATLTNG
jgi:methylmalonyl-CoA mutase